MPKVSVDQASSAVEGAVKVTVSWPARLGGKLLAAGAGYELQHAAELSGASAKATSWEAVYDGGASTATLRLRDDAIDRATNHQLRLRARTCARRRRRSSRRRGRWRTSSR